MFSNSKKYCVNCSEVLSNPKFMYCFRCLDLKSSGHFSKCTHIKQNGERCNIQIYGDKCHYHKKQINLPTKQPRFLTPIC